MECFKDIYLIQHVDTVTGSRKNNEPSTCDLILTNEQEIINNLHVKDPLKCNQHCVMEFQIKCNFEQYNISKERWNYFKGNYEQMNKKIGFRLGQNTNRYQPEQAV